MMKLIFIVFFFFGCKTLTKDSKDKKGESVQEGTLSSQLENNHPNWNVSYAIILGPGFGRAPYEVGVLNATTSCGVKVGVVAGSGTGLYVGRMFAYNKKTFEWNVFKLADVKWWADSTDEIPEVSRLLQTELEKNYHEPDVSQIPILLQRWDGNSVQYQFQEVGNVEKLDRHFYLPGFLSQDLGGVNSEIQFDPYPVEEIRKLGFKKIIVVNLLGDILKNKQTEGLQVLERSLLTTIQAVSANKIKKADFILEPKLSSFPLKAKFKSKFSELKLLGFKDAKALFVKEGFECR